MRATTSGEKKLVCTVVINPMREVTGISAAARIGEQDRILQAHRCGVEPVRAPRIGHEQVVEAHLLGSASDRHLRVDVERVSATGEHGRRHGVDRPGVRMEQTDSHVVAFPPVAIVAPLQGERGYPAGGSVHTTGG